MCFAKPCEMPEASNESGSAQNFPRLESVLIATRGNAHFGGVFLVFRHDETGFLFAVKAVFVLRLSDLPPSTAPCGKGAVGFGAVQKPVCQKVERAPCSRGLLEPACLTVVEVAPVPVLQRGMRHEIGDRFLSGAWRVAGFRNIVRK